MGINRKLFTKIYKASSIILYTLLIIWFFLSGLELRMNCAILVSNTNAVQEDPSALMVEHINENGDLYLEDTSVVRSNAIKEYVRTVKGSGTYYIVDGSKMSAEITKQDSYDLCFKFVVLDFCVFIICLYLLKVYGNSALFLLYSVISIFNILVIGYYSRYILEVEFFVGGIILVVWLAVFFLHRLWGSAL